MSSSDFGSSSSGSSGSSSSSDGPATPPSTHASLPGSLKEARGSAADINDGSAPAAAPWLEPHTFHTLRTQARFQQPSADAFDHPDLQALTAPHIESFNALWAEDPSLDAGGDRGAAGASTFSSLPLPGGALGEGVGLLAKALQNLPPRVVFDGKGANGEELQPGPGVGRGNRLQISIDSVSLGRPQVSDRARGAVGKKMFPSEVSESLAVAVRCMLNASCQCRERLRTYTAKMTARVKWSVNGGPPQLEDRDMGFVPVMVKVCAG